MANNTYAVIETGGKQYRVTVGDVIEVELLDAEVDSTLKFTDIIGKKLVCVAKVIDHARGEKLNIFKYKAKKNERKRQGHRQPHTLLKIEEIK